MTVSVIVPTLAPDGEMAQQCAASIGPDVEVVIVHDKDRDGFVATCTRGVEQSTGDVLVFLNDDTIPQSGWVAPLVAAVDDDTIAGALLYYPDGSVQHSGVFFRRRGLILEAFNRLTPAPSGEVPAVTGACFAVARSTWDRLGGFDAGFRNGYEDVDLCLRHREAGGSVRFVAESVVVHLESQSSGRFDHAQENVALLQERWGDLPI